VVSFFSFLLVGWCMGLVVWLDGWLVGCCQSVRRVVGWRLRFGFVWCGVVYAVLCMVRVETMYGLLWRGGC
jgi:hypothetical protein